MGKLDVHYNKTLKLSNVCIRELTEQDIENIDQLVYQQENYIKSKGALPIGPLVQCTEKTLDTNGEFHLKISIIRQSSTLISRCEAPYQTQALLRIKNCLFLRLSGEEWHLKYAYDKLNLVAFEEDIALTGRTFTVITTKKGEPFAADIFTETISQS